MVVLLCVVLALAALVVLVRDDEVGQVGSVTTVGDSLNVGMEPYLDDELRGWRLVHRNENGRRTAEGVAELRALGDALAQVVVVSLGTNDAGSDPAAFRGHVDEVLALAGPSRCIVWLTISLGGPEELNGVLEDAARRHPNLELADWATLVEEEPELLAVDGLHGTPDGYERRAELVAGSARACLPDETTP